MFHIPPAARETTTFVVRRALLVPICLCLVAGLHAYRVARCNQTAWKGGGFGMFSTVDAENARYLKLYLITAEGEFPIGLPGEMKKRAAELRAAPNQEATKDFAKRLARFHWIDSQAMWSRTADEALSLQDRPADASLLHPTPATTGGIWTYRPSGAISPLEATKQRDGATHIPFSAVRVEVWRFGFDRATSRLNAQRWFEATHAKPEADA